MAGSLIRFLAVLTAMLIFTGCGAQEKVDELETYRTQMESFFERIAGYDESLKAVDLQSDTAQTDILAIIDLIADDFIETSEVTAPEEYSAAQEVLAAAAEDMRQARNDYHDAFEAEEFDSGKFDTAEQYYARANERLELFKQVLRGEAEPVEVSEEAAESTETAE